MKRLIGGVLTAAALAVVFIHLVPIDYCDWAWWVLECWIIS